MTLHDTYCRDLARIFLEDEPSTTEAEKHRFEQRLDALASEIQCAIEDWLNENPIEPDEPVVTELITASDIQIGNWIDPRTRDRSPATGDLLKHYVTAQANLKAVKPMVDAAMGLTPRTTCAVHGANPPADWCDDCYRSQLAADEAAHHRSTEES